MRIYLLCFLLALLLAACKENPTPSANTVRPVKYERIGFSTGFDTHEFSGVAQAKNETNLSFKVSGTLSSVNVKLGDRVKKGQLIATIDPIDYNIQSEQAVSQKEGSVANLQSSEANIKAAESQLINARSTYERVTRLYESNSIPLSEYQQAKAGLEAAEAQYNAAVSQRTAAKTTVQTAEKQVQAAGNQVQYTRLFSPMDGVITAVYAEANEMVGSGRVIASVSSQGKPEVAVGVPEVLINRMEKGAPVTITLPSVPGQQFKGTVDQVAYAAGNSPTYPVIIEISENPGLIRPGMAANVQFRLPKFSSQAKNQLIAPVAAVGKETEGAFVYVLNQESDQTYVVAKRNITLGELFPEGFEVKQGLKENELVATAGLKSLMDGMEVTLLEE